MKAQWWICVGPQFVHNVTWRLKAGIVAQKEAAIAKQRDGRHLSSAKNKHLTIEELLEAVFLMRSVSRLYIEAQRKKWESGYTRFGAGSNTSTVTLWVVGDDEKGTQYLGKSLPWGTWSSR
jgi:hypothetical protein